MLILTYEGIDYIENDDNQNSTVTKIKLNRNITKNNNSVINAKTVTTKIDGSKEIPEIESKRYYKLDKENWLLPLIKAF